MDDRCVGPDRIIPVTALAEENRRKYTPRSLGTENEVTSRIPFGHRGLAVSTGCTDGGIDGGTGNGGPIPETEKMLFCYPGATQGVRLGSGDLEGEDALRYHPQEAGKPCVPGIGDAPREIPLELILREVALGDARPPPRPDRGSGLGDRIRSASRATLPRSASRSASDPKDPTSRESPATWTMAPRLALRHFSSPEVRVDMSSTD
jgi:hypothetical protein